MDFREFTSATSGILADLRATTEKTLQVAKENQADLALAKAEWDVIEGLIGRIINHFSID